jgi:hypothetical protein
MDNTLRVAVIVGGKPAGKPVDVSLNSFGVMSFLDEAGNTITTHDYGLRSLIDTLLSGGSVAPPKTIRTEGTGSAGVVSNVQDGLKIIAERH